MVQKILLDVVQVWPAFGKCYCRQKSANQLLDQSVYIFLCCESLHGVFNKDMKMSFVLFVLDCDED